ncbi:MAG TPA: FHA domain-containing serine/threonine-protein kinase [Anaerolineae bacterium]|nr:FHA domain-containing serine/threonine-protein kinase [Anaerolineae bacterium]
MTSEQIGNTIAGRYRIVEKLGAGGLSAVYKAVDVNLNRFVALKVLGAHLVADPEFEARFRREATAGMLLNHPNLVRVYDYGRTDRTVFIVSEYIEGRSLADILADGRPLGEEYAVQIVRQVAEALAYAHKRGIAHRDVKPGNIFISVEGRVVLLDLGLASAITSSRSSLTSTGTIVGTPTHMAPEQARGERVDERSDIYSLGVVLYQLLTGRLPFGGEQIAEVLRKMIYESPPLPRSLNPYVSSAMEQVVLKALAKDPGQRYQTADELIAAVTGAGASAPFPELAARPVPAVSPAGLAPSASAAPAQRRGTWSIGITILAAVVCLVLCSLPILLVGSSGSTLIEERPLLVGLLAAGAVAVPVATWAGARVVRTWVRQRQGRQARRQPMGAQMTAAGHPAVPVGAPPSFSPAQPAVPSGSATSSIEMITGETIPFAPQPFAATQLIREEPSAMAWLLVLNGPQRGRQLRLADAVTVGRAETSDIVLPDAAASRRHAQVRLVGERFYIDDLGSSNGTFVNGLGIPMAQPAQLRDRDEIRMGNTTMLFIQAASPEDLTAEAKRRLDQFDSVWRDLTRSVHHD